MHENRCVLGFVALLLGLGQVRAQVSSPDLLAKIRAKMSGNLARLPNYTCIQTIERSRQDARKKHFEMQDRVRLEVALVGGRELFAWPGSERIDEAELGKLLGSGTYGNGNFGIFARGVFLTDAPQFTYMGETQWNGRRAVEFRYLVPVGASEYRIKVNEQEATVGYHGAFWVDAQTLDLLRLEVNANEIPPALDLKQADDAIDYARTAIGTSDFLLPRASEVVMQDLAGNARRNRTSFGECRQFSGESVLSFADTDAPAAPATTASPSVEIELPQQFRADASLENPVTAEETAVGDSVSLELKDPIKSDGKILAPKGAIVKGRVIRAENTGEAFLLGLRFDSLQFGDKHSDLHGRHLQCRVADVMAPNSTFQGELEDGTLVFAAGRLRLPRGFRFSLGSRPVEAAREAVKVQPPRPELKPPASAPKRQPVESAPLARSGTTAVMVDAIVTDRKGRHVSGLTVRDFQLYEDNSPQTITAFTPPEPRAKRQEKHASGLAGSPVSSPGPAQHTPQLVTLLIDLGDLHSDAIHLSCQAASQFAQKTIDAGNLISVYWLSSSLHLGTPFTRDKQKTIEVIDKISAYTPAGPFTVYERDSAQNELDFYKHQALPLTVPGGGSSPVDPMGAMRNVLRTWITTANALQARQVFVALRAMALAYRDLPGRKTVVVFSEGFLHAYNEKDSMQAVIDAANRANVAIYVLDAGGLSVNAPDRSDKNNSSAEKATYDRPDSSPDVGEGPPDRVTNGMNRFDWLQTLGTDRHSDLGWISSATGGFLIQDTNDIGSGLDRIEEDASQYYALVYTPSNHNYDGSYRNIKVELTGRGYRVRHRRGYWAFPPGSEVMMTPAAAQLLATVESGERKASFVPELNAILVPANGGFTVAAAVSMPGRLVHFEKVKDEHEAGVSVLLLARNASGKLAAAHEGYGSIRLNSQDYKDFASKLFNWQGHVALRELEPVAVQAIVRFADGTVGISRSQMVGVTPGMVLADQAEDTPCTPSPTEPLCIQGERLRLPAQARFSRSTNLEVYWMVMGASPDLRIEFRIDAVRVIPKKLAVFPGEIPLSYGVVAVLDLVALEPGDHTIQMTAESSRGRATETAQLKIQ